MVACCVVGCNNRSTAELKAKKGITFHAFPFKEPERLQLWIDNLNRETNWIPTKFSRLCSIHFTRESFDRSGQIVRLKPDAVPTIFTYHKKTYKRRHLDSENETEECSSVSDTNSGAVCTFKVKFQKTAKKKSSSNVSTASLSKNLEDSGDEYNDIKEGIPKKKMKRVRPTCDDSKPVVSLQEVKEKLAASLEDIKKKLTASASTTTTRHMVKNASPAARQMDLACDPNITIKEEEVGYEEAIVSPMKKLPGQDKVTKLSNNCIHFEFASPKRQVLLKLNPKVDFSILKSETLEDLLTSLNERKLLSSDGEDLLNAFGGLPKGLRRNNDKANASKISKLMFTEEVKKFATMLFLSSPEAYDVVCKVFKLPEKSTIQARRQVKDYWPGFTQEALTLLRNKVPSKRPADRVCSIMLDCVCVKRQFDFDPPSGRWIGHVDFGGGQEPGNTDEILLATEVLMFTAVGLGNEWKVPFGYFLNKAVSGELLKNLILEAVLALEECGLDVRAIVCNGSTSCIKMGKLFGCNIRTKTFSEMTTSFPHPLNEKRRIYLIFGIRHALKLLMHLLKDKGILRSSTYGVVNWMYFKKLFGDKRNGKLEAVDLISPNHINFYHLQKIVRLCNSSFNSTVSCALELADELNLKSYSGCQSTSSFAADIHRAFDLLNSRNPVSSEDKPPIYLSTMQEQVESMMDVAERLFGLELRIDERVIKEGRWMSVVLFAFTLKSVSYLATDLLNDKTLRYFCTYRVNLDHLDMILANLQRRGGWDGMPSPAEFRFAYKSLFDESCMNAFYNYDFEGEDLTVGQGEIYPYKSCPSISFFDISGNIGHCPSLIDLRTDVTNRARYVIRQVSQRLSCPECMGILLDNDYSNDINTKKVVIDFIRPSKFILKILKTSERVLRAKLIESSLVENEHLVFQIYSEYFSLNDTLDIPNTAVSHMMEEPHHIMCLMKVVIRSYVTFRLHKRKEFRKRFKLLKYS